MSKVPVGGVIALLFVEDDHQVPERGRDFAVAVWAWSMVTVQVLILGSAPALLPLDEHRSGPGTTVSVTSVPGE